MVASAPQMLGMCLELPDKTPKVTKVKVPCHPAKTIVIVPHSHRPKPQSDGHDSDD